MKLQDFLGTDLKYDYKDMAADEALTRQIQVRLIDMGLLDPPADGLFGPLSTAAFDRFQDLMQVNEMGYLGAATARLIIQTRRQDLPKPPPELKILQNTVFKSRPVQSSVLPENEKRSIPAGESFTLVDYEVVRDHLRIALRSVAFPKRGDNGKVEDSKIWYAFRQHVEIWEEEDRQVPLQKPTTIRLDVPYKSQLDNWYNPMGSCNVTSIAMCLSYLGARRRSSVGQFEDELYEYMIRRGWSRHSPYDLARVVHDYGCRDTFRTNATIEEAQDWLAGGNPAVIHGYFTSFGHIIVLVGYDDRGFIVHDPYGEWFEWGYRNDLSGAFLHYSYGLIRRVCIPDGQFWVHFISR
ncbi:MAG: C39 family peptidase [Phormidium sp. BM_Day4_Bin.17]|nr:C39 family peptidase [Phormidium sp. BM_Day4_Bin.17]UCJ14165.1 MAG: C39 family peptidase [Phormidium sp. PBR-2020]